MLHGVFVRVFWIPGTFDKKVLVTKTVTKNDEAICQSIRRCSPGNILTDYFVIFCNSFCNQNLQDQFFGLQEESWNCWTKKHFDSYQSWLGAKSKQRKAEIVLIKNMFIYFFILTTTVDLCSLHDVTCPRLIMKKFRSDNIIIWMLRNKVIKAVLMILQSLMLRVLSQFVINVAFCNNCRIL